MTGKPENLKRFGCGYFECVGKSPQLQGFIEKGLEEIAPLV
jgi:hypothetical protein